MPGKNISKNKNLVSSDLLREGGGKALAVYGQHSLEKCGSRGGV